MRAQEVVEVEHGTREHRVVRAAGTARPRVPRVCVVGAVATASGAGGAGRLGRRGLTLGTASGVEQGVQGRGVVLKWE